MQALASLDCPVSDPYVPLGQLVQASWRLTFAAPDPYVEFGHSLGHAAANAEFPLLDDWPANFPLGQSFGHAFASLAWDATAPHFPAGHGTRLLPPLQKNPIGHGEHAALAVVCPAAVPYVLAPQLYRQASLSTDFPVTFPYFPEGHFVAAPPLPPQ